MSAGVYDITIEQGSTFAMEVVLTSDGTLPINLDGYLGRGQIRHKSSDTTPVAAFVVQIIDPAAGKIGISLSAAASTAIPLRGHGYSEKTEFFYDVEIYQGVDDATKVIRVLNGACFMSPEITK